MSQEKPVNEIEGQIERITYSNKENSYTIAKIRMQDRGDLVTVVGTLYSVTPGDTLKLKGQWNRHPRYGEQFQVASYEPVMPATVKGIEKYLGSGMIRGIGPVMAKRLVSRFGEETLKVIDTNIERLFEVQGVGEKRVEMIKDAWEEQSEIRSVMVFLQGNGISPTYAAKIYKQYGSNSVRVVTENPYRLAMDVFGIGFITADKIAGNLGIEKTAPARIEAGIIYVLSQLADQGHVYYPYASLIEQCGEILQIDGTIIPPALEILTQEKKIYVEQALAPNSGAQLPSTAPVYLAGFYLSERGIATKLKALCSYPKQQQLINVDEAVDWVRKDLNISFSAKQLEGIRASVESKLMVLTGGPGTGKTTIINAIIRIAHRMGQRVLLTAPTGRAAKRMAETTGHESKTIHRLLEYSPSRGSDGGGFKRDENNPLDADLVIVDEVSMVDTLLMHHFLKAVPEKATLILVGDVDQLPSVGPGNVLRDIIEAGIMPVVRLNEIFRQSQRSMIIVNAHRVNHGEMPELERKTEHAHDFYFTALEEPEKVVEEIVRLYKEVIPSRFGFDPMNDIQVLTPMHRGVVGVTNLNAELQKELNPCAHELVRAGKLFKTGDKVLQTRNNYDKDIYNGDIGRIRAIDTEVQEVKVDYDGRIISYEYADLDEIILAYAISVHKSQGSEYPVV
ncbi:MAG TPA: ATP-dependent RecD-like DNA helicase, partial [Syntrophorhabdaceae bacterium]|nr:ATP-dependent RecD-like DNA helicase [Syntrophorhabdaceae bacterium]